MKIEFINLNADSALDPEIKTVPLSEDSKNKPPSFCLPWVEAARYSIQIKANEDYVIRKGKKSLDAWADRGGNKLPLSDLNLEVPQGMNLVPKNDKEYLEKKMHVSQSPSFSSPWQRKRHHSVTLKVGIYWWTPPGWGLFISSAVHRNEEFRVVEGFVRTDLWHRDIPLVILPLTPEIRIKKYSILASALLVPAQDIQLASASGDPKRIQEIVEQVNKKRMKPHIYKKLVLKS